MENRLNGPGGGRPEAEELLRLARREIGVKENPPGSNRVKYNTAYYGRETGGGGYSWCAVFLWWLFQQAGAPELYYGGRKTAYVPALLAYARRQGETAETPRPGDLVCFDFNGNRTADHIGLCESFDGEYVTTIDGNTGSSSENNGGEVMRRRRHKRYILGVIRPAYGEEEMTEQQFDAMMASYLARRGELEPSPWSEKAREWAEQNRVLSGDGQKMGYQRLCTREELVQMLYNAREKS